MSKSSQKVYRSIYRVVQRAEEAERKYNREVQSLAKIEAGIQEREHTGKTKVGYLGYHKDMCRMAKTLQRRIIKLEARKRELSEKCLASFVGYPIVPDLIHARDMDMPHHWKSIPKLRKDLSKPLSNLNLMDKWEQRVLASYSDEQIERELLAFSQGRIEGTRRRDGVTEYLLP
jgi:hypothetical protein